MNARLRHLSFRRFGTSELHLRYLEDDPDLQELTGARPRDADDLLRRAPLSARRLVPPVELGRALRAYAERHGAPPAVLDNADAIARGEAVVVVTGQQPGLFGGPLYTLYKAATAIRLARELSARPGAPRVLPLFWNHSDDHDLDEVNRAFLVNPNQELQRYRLELAHAGEPIRNLPVGRALAPVLAAAGDLLPRTEFRDDVWPLFAPGHDDETFGDALARLLFGLFGAHGLLVIEPRDLPPSAFEVLPRWRSATRTVRDAVRQISEHLTDLGLDVTLDPGTTLMFQFGAGQRRAPLLDGEPFDRAEQLSPGVLLRPLWQDACLPSIGFVVGPGELSYLAVVASLYKQLGVPRPCLVPRASLTLVEPSMVKQLERFGWDIPDLEPGPDELARVLEGDDDSGPEGALAELSEDLRRRLGEVGEQLRATDRQMLGPLERSRGKMLDELDKLRQKVRNSRQNRQGTGLRQIRRLCANLRPRSRPQERVLGPLSYVVSHGPGLADLLIDACDPFMVQHGVLEL
ncbi:MAG: bacillithiol biosynthesis BshC [Planctomycetes bacterium]|nr:bacillithiol biosynthesis BshC [Planctomycetota bacterium]